MNFAIFFFIKRGDNLIFHTKEFIHINRIIHKQMKTLHTKKQTKVNKTKFGMKKFNLITTKSDYFHVMAT